MVCSEIEARLFDLLDGRLSGADEVRAHGHLETCAACRARVEKWQQALPAMRAAAPPPPDFARTRRMERAIGRALAEPPAPVPAVSGLRFWLTGALLAVAAFALVFGRNWLFPRDTGLARVEGVQGSVIAGRAPLHAGAVVPLGETIQVGEGGRMVLALGRRAVARVEGPAHLVVQSAAQVVRVRLEGGQLSAEVEPRGVLERFIVELRDGRVEVRGTKFAVGYEGQGSWLRVEEGKVAAYDRADRLVRVVAAGETHWLAPRGTPAPAPPAEVAEAPAPAADSCEELQRSCATAVTRTRAAIRASDPRRAIAASAAEGVAIGGCGLERARLCLDELQYLRAEALRLAGRLPDAVRAYRALDRTSASATTRQNALFAAAELERRLGQKAAALRDYQRALAVSGATGLREEALLGLMETAEETGDGRTARDAARRYLAGYPAGHGAPRARALLARQGGP